MAFDIQKQFPLFFGSIVIIIFSACSSTKKLSSTTGSRSRFINGVEINATTSTAKHTTRTTEIPSIKEDATPKNIAASSLQMKYAVMLNTAPSQLQNADLLQEIDDWYGVPYRYGGTTKDGIDCSAFSQTVMQDVYSQTVPRTAQEQFDNRDAIDKTELQEGDLVFFHTSGRKSDITHVGVYLANNKFIHASTSNGISISDLDDPYWKPRYRGAGRHQ